MLSIRQFKKVYIYSGALFAGREFVTVSKLTKAIVDQVQTLEESYLELQALRAQVHRAERTNAKAADCAPKGKPDSASKKD